MKCTCMILPEFHEIMLVLLLLQLVLQMCKTNLSIALGFIETKNSHCKGYLKDPRILLLDEATGALDAESERIVQDALDRVMVNRTTVVVAHRLTTIKGAYMIAVVKNGVIAEKGSHDVLMKITDGAYASLVALHSSST
ncbi:hypothetical protein ACLB2K_059960 [Fragaria x ananassa]